MKFPTHLYLLFCFTALALAQGFDWKIPKAPKAPKVTVIPPHEPIGLYKMDICRAFKTMEVVLDNYTVAIHRLDAAYDSKGSWRDAGESLVDWLRQLSHWDELIREGIAQLWATTKWSKENQAEGASCYTDYFVEARNTLVMLAEFSARYPWDGDFRCIMFNILNTTAQDYEDMADRLYHYSEESKDGLFSDDFPGEIPEYWCVNDCTGSTKPHPRLNSSIAHWMRNQDKPIARPLKNGTFHQTLKAWGCEDRTKKPAQGDLRWKWTGLQKNDGKNKANSTKVEKVSRLWEFWRREMSYYG